MGVPGILLDALGVLGGSWGVPGIGPGCSSGRAAKAPKASRLSEGVWGVGGPPWGDFWWFGVVFGTDLGGGFVQISLALDVFL